MVRFKIDDLFQQAFCHGGGSLRLLEHGLEEQYRRLHGVPFQRLLTMGDGGGDIAGIGERLGLHNRIDRGRQRWRWSILSSRLGHGRP